MSKPQTISKTKQCKNTELNTSMKNRASNTLITSSLRKHNNKIEDFNTNIKLNQEQDIFFVNFFFSGFRIFQLY